MKYNGETTTIHSCWCQWLVTHRVKHQHLIFNLNLSTFSFPSSPKSRFRNFPLPPIRRSSAKCRSAHGPKTELHNRGTVPVYKRAIPGRLHLKILLTAENWSRLQLIPHNPLFARGETLDWYSTEHYLLANTCKLISAGYAMTFSPLNPALFS